MVETLNWTDLKTGSKATEGCYCYGTFDVIHPGHIRYLKAATDLGRPVSVVLPYDENIEARVGILTSINWVDRIVLLDPGVSLLDFLEDARPKQLLLGREYFELNASNETQIVSLCDSSNVRLTFFSGEVRPVHKKANWQGQRSKVNVPISLDFKNKLRASNLNLNNSQEFFKAIKSLKILVVGDLIVDKYIHCEALGLSSEAPIPVLNELYSERYLGGAAAVARHVKGLGASCTLATLVGGDEDGREAMLQLKSEGIDVYAEADQARPTTVKSRYLADDQKLMRITKAVSRPVDMASQERWIKNIGSNLNLYDAVIVSDFSYGCITEYLLNSLINSAFRSDFILAGDSQVNASSRGTRINLFQNFDLISPTERELRTALVDFDGGLEELVNKFVDRVSPKHLLVTLGADGFVGYEYDDGARQRSSRYYVPAVYDSAKDPSGCGDCLLAVMTLCIAAGVPVGNASLLAAISAGLEAQKIGNIELTEYELTDWLKRWEDECESW